MVNKYEQLSKKLILNDFTMYLNLYKVVTKIIYYNFYTVCRTPNNSWLGFYKYENALFYPFKLDNIK